MAVTISGTDGIVGAGFTVDNSGVSVTAGVGTFSSLQGSGANLTSLPAAQLTGALPAISAANCTNIPAANITGTLPAISGANLTGIAGGITEVDCWRIHTTFQGGANPITSNWERFDTAGEEKLGTGMSESSGVFSFPSTGYWEIMFHSNFYSGGDHRTCILYLKVSTDGGSNYVYNTDGYGDLYWGDSGNGYQSAEATQILKVTSTTNYKLTFAVSTATDSSVYWIGGSSQNHTYVIFKKLADV